MADEEMSIRELLGSLKISQLWKFASALIGLLLGTFAFGHFIQITKNDREILKKDTIISSLNLELQQKTTDIVNLTNAKNAEIENFRASVKVGADLLRTLDFKSRFLGQYITYLRGETEDSKNIFVDLICAMWREDQIKRVKFLNEPFSLTAAQVAIGNVHEDVAKILSEAGVSIDLAERIRRMRVDPHPIDIRKSEMATQENNLLKQQFNASMVRASLMKVVSFSETESYVLPDEIAAAVHLRENCKP